MPELPESVNPGDPIRADMVNEILRRIRRSEAMTFNSADFDEIDSGSGRSVSLAPARRVRQTSTAPLIWPVIVRDVRDDEDHFITVQDVERTSGEVWDGLMQPKGSAYKASVWAHGKARDYRALITRQETLTRETPIIPAVMALGQPWVMQYLRFDLIQPRDRMRYTDCVAAFV